MEIKRTSMITRAINRLDLDVTAEQIKEWEDGGLIQVVFAHLSPADREFIMTGITQSEWDSAFPEEDTWDDDENINDDYAAAAEAQHESWGDQWLE